MPPQPSFTTGEWMRLVVLVALNLILFQEIRAFLLFPPITLAVIALNFVLFHVLVRPRSSRAGVVGLLLGGIVASVTIFLYLTPLGRDAVIARTLLEVLPEHARDQLPQSLQTAPGRHYLEFAILDLAGLAFMFAGAWLTAGLRRLAVKGRSEKRSLG